MRTTERREFKRHFEPAPEEMPAERLQWLGKLSPVRRSLPRSIATAVLWILLPLGGLILAGLLVRHEAWDVISIWVRRIYAQSG